MEVVKIHHLAVNLITEDRLSINSFSSGRKTENAKIKDEKFLPIHFSKLNSVKKLGIILNFKDIFFVVKKFCYFFTQMCSFDIHFFF